jgi:transcription elongation factor GreA
MKKTFLPVDQSPRSKLSGYEMKDKNFAASSGESTFVPRNRDRTIESRQSIENLSGVFMEKVPITKEGFEKLKKELDNIKNVAIPENIRDIEVARSHGDLSENAEYAAAKERQSYLHGKSQELENNLASCNIINITGIGSDKVVFGSYVTIADIDSDDGEEIKYQLVGPFESDISLNKISVTSPIGRALIGKGIDSEIIVKTPGGVRKFQIIDISCE